MYAAHVLVWFGTISREIYFVPYQQTQQANLKCFLTGLAKRAVQETASCIGVILNYVFEYKRDDVLSLKF